MTDFEQIARAARNGDTKAVEELVQSCYSDVWRLCALLVDSKAADDLTQETFAQALRGLARYRGEASGRTWILSIARNVCADELRRRVRRRRRDGRLTDLAHIAADAAPDPAGAATMSLLGELDLDRRAAFVLTQLFRLSYEEAATVCGCPPGTIRSRVARARAQLIELLGYELAAGGTVG